MKRAATVAITALALAGVSPAALAAWGYTGSGAGSAQSDSKPIVTPAAPTTSVSGTTVTINFSAVATTNELQPASSYVMRRYTAVSGGSVIGTAFSCTRPAPCTDGRPEGSTTHYTYTPKWGNGWTGVESSRSTAAAIPSTATLTAQSLTLTNSSGGQAGRVNNGDTFSVTFSEAIRPSTVCSSFSDGSTSVQTLGGGGGSNGAFTLQLKNNAGAITNDQVMLIASSAACSGTVHLGTLDLGSPNWTTQDRYYNATGSNAVTLSVSGDHKTLTIRVGSGTTTPVSPASAISASTSTFTPSATIKDDATNAVAASGTRTTTTLF